MANFVDDVMNKNFDVTSLLQNTFTLRRSRVVIFADIHKIVTMFIKKTLKSQKMLKELEIMYRNASYICIS